MACDVDTLLEEGKCYSRNCLTQGQQEAVKLSLLCQINDALGGGGGGGGGGGLGIARGAGSPEGVVTGGTTTNGYINLSNGGFWIFEGVSGANTGWVQLVGP